MGKPLKRLKNIRLLQIDDAEKLSFFEKNLFYIKRKDKSMKKLIQLLTLPILMSCTTSKIVTTNIQDLTAFETNAQVYALPKTSFIFEVIATRHNFQPGPFQKYTKRFLGIDGAKSMSEAYWHLEQIEIKRLVEPDIDHYYSVKFIGDFSIENSLFDLGKSGLIISHDMIPSYKQYNSDVIDEVEQIHFTDLSISPYIDKEKKKKAKNTGKDFEGGDIPYWQKHISGKTIEEKAFEASKFIFKIRKRRFKLLSGQYEVFPEGTALETSIEELNNLEELYLSLFIGKTETDTIRRSFTFSPVANEVLQRENLFRFSEETGFHLSDSDMGSPIILVVNDLEQNQSLNQLQLPLAESENVLFYRLPDKGLLKVLYGSHVLLESVNPVYQFGVLMPLYVNQHNNLLGRNR